MQHGVIDYAQMVTMLQAVSSTDVTPLVRVPWNEPGIIGKSLDAGARGVIIPMVNSRADAERAVQACRYAPLGARSYGPVRANYYVGLRLLRERERRRSLHRDDRDARRRRPCRRDPLGAGHRRGVRRTGRPQRHPRAPAGTRPRRARSSPTPSRAFSKRAARTASFPASRAISRPRRSGSSKASGSSRSRPTPPCSPAAPGSRCRLSRPIARRIRSPRTCDVRRGRCLVGSSGTARSSTGSATATSAVVDFVRASRRDLADALDDARGLLVDSHVTADAALLELAPRLRVLSTISVGFDHIDLAAASQRADHRHAHAVLSDAVADLTLGLILMTVRRLGEAVDIVAHGGWDDALLGIDLRAKTLLIVGLGRIGREVARRATRLQDARLRVRHARRSPRHCRSRTGRDARRGPRPRRRRLPARRPQPHDPSSHRRRRARGDEADRVRDQHVARRSGRPGSADFGTRRAPPRRARASTCCETEPPGADEPLLAMRNVVVLPHIGSATVETRRAMLDCAIDNLATCLRGERCEHTLDQPRSASPRAATD